MYDHFQITIFIFRYNICVITQYNKQKFEDLIVIGHLHFHAHFIQLQYAFFHFHTPPNTL